MSGGSPSRPHSCGWDAQRHPDDAVDADIAEDIGRAMGAEEICADDLATRIFAPLDRVLPTLYSLAAKGSIRMRVNKAALVVWRRA